LIVLTELVTGKAVDDTRLQDSIADERSHAGGQRKGEEGRVSTERDQRCGQRRLCGREWEVEKRRTLPVATLPTTNTFAIPPLAGSDDEDEDDPVGDDAD
jgi:hypothetical protein